jgi:multiple sugar transport system permease protein
MLPIKRILVYTLLVTAAATMLLPLLWMASTALKTPGDVFAYPPRWIPEVLQWSNFVDAWNAAPFRRFYLNSLFVACCVSTGQVCTSALAAYAFARLEFPGRDKLFLGYLATLMIPQSVTMIPVFILIRSLGWVNTYQALIVPLMFSAYGTFLLRQFFMGIPRDLEEAARMDGCGYVRTFVSIILPLSKPALATLSIFTFTGNWSLLMWPLIVTYSDDMRTLPVGLMVFRGGYTTEWHLLMAASLFVMLPVIIVFVFAQRHFVEGIKMTGFGGA